MTLLGGLAGGLAGCAHVFPEPYPVTAERMAVDLGRHFHEVFPEADGPDGEHDAGLLAPRFGAPAIARRGEPFAVELLERGGPVAIRAALVRFDLPAASVSRCLAEPAAPVEDCFPLRLDDGRWVDVTPGLRLQSLRAAPIASPPARTYDLVIVSAVDPPQRARRAVVLTDEDPTAPREIRVVQLSDLHLGKTGRAGRIQEDFATLVRDVNALAPDLVVVTGDMAEQGRSLSLEEWAGGLLLQIDAPLLAIAGNHEYGHFPKIRDADVPDRGWLNFARVFHPWRFTQVAFAGWEFVGFDSGPSIFSSRILTRGVLPETIDRIRATLDEADRNGRRGVVLFSHAPTRAVLRTDSGERSPDEEDDGGDGLGSMYYGAQQLEDVLLASARRGQRVLHLSGHTHWADVFEARPDAASGGFARHQFDGLVCSHAIDGKVALINAPSATVVTFHTVKHGLRSGFVDLGLDARDTRVRFDLRDSAGRRAACPVEK